MCLVFQFNFGICKSQVWQWIPFYCLVQNGLLEVFIAARYNRMVPCVELHNVQHGSTFRKSDTPHHSQPSPHLLHHWDPGTSLVFEKICAVVYAEIEPIDFFGCTVA